MTIASAQDLCLQLISSAFQRCRTSEDLCRLSVLLKRSPPSDPRSVQISVSDTGVGSCAEEFGGLKLRREAFGAQIWDGLLFVTTTGIGDDEIHHYQLNLKESASGRRLTRLPSNLKNGLQFSGTEVRLSIFENIDVLLPAFCCFFRKILMLKIPNVSIELVVEQGDAPGSRYVNVFVANEGRNPLPFAASNLERLRSGVEDYVFKHGNTLGKKCESCFSSGEHLKIGSGAACCTESRRYPGSVMEAVIVISEMSEVASTCPRTCSSKTEVLYFKDFTPCPIPQSSLKALTSIDWKSYGLSFGSVVDQGGFAIVEWDNLPPSVQIDIVLHHYHEQIPSARRKTRPDQNLIKKAIKLALNDLKDNYAGVLLSAHAVKVRSYAPDLAKTISSLILSSNDADFREECCSFLGLQSQGVGGEAVEDCIREKIIAVVEMHDREPQRSKELPTFLFEDDHLQEFGSPDGEYEGEGAFGSMDIC
ncbi:type 2 DNA topoisomerase 6 subunit B-like isoform X2 [Malus sylvestris]|uniref:type 2 DNA topoisomerase 6 subunit B-like isoform X2 n=1 Tax=Malus sylvestris TaxID=3752 RepID=UPI0021ABB47F|nr:type 2 DNA topoisomerase 6 subunit B-like isoform X2 [Malus sylvestris]